MSFLLVLYQDMKTRLVYWVLFPVIAVCAGVLLYDNMLWEVMKATLMFNLGFVFFLIAAVFVYSKLKLKTTLSHAFGLGDMLLFFALAFTFSSISFVVVFVFGLLFSLVLHLILKSKGRHQTVPLAGYMSLFFALTYIGYWLGLLQLVYSI